MPSSEMTLDEPWDADVAGAREEFGPSLIADQPEPIRRYLGHSIAPGTPLVRAVRFEMDGQIRLNGRWIPFEGEQVIRWDRGLIWKAKARFLPGVSIEGSDRIIDGEARMRWDLLGIVPVIRSEGRDLSRSASGRLELEAIWLPSVLLDDDVRWLVRDPAHLTVEVHVPGDRGRLALTLDESGRLTGVVLARWGNPEGRNFHLVSFGRRMEREETFHGYTVPTQIRAGWFYGSDRIETEGELFRAQLRDLRYR